MNKVKVTETATPGIDVTAPNQPNVIVPQISTTKNRVKVFSITTWSSFSNAIGKEKVFLLETGLISLGWVFLDKLLSKTSDLLREMYWLNTPD